MKGKTKQIKTKRELAEKLPKPFYDELSKKLSVYGNGRLLSSKTNISYRTIAIVLESRKATRSVQRKIAKALKSIAA